MSKTPRTDEWRYDQECNYEITWDDNCEQLETELSDLKAQFAEYVRAEEKYNPDILAIEKDTNRIKLREKAKQTLGL